MARYLLDTNHASLLYRQDARVQAHFGALDVTDRTYLCLPVVGELWFMVENSARVEANARLMELFLSAFDHLEFDDGAAREFGRLRAESRRRGRHLAGVDAQVAAIARTNGLTLLSDDQDFDGLEGVTVENWLR